MVNLMWTTQYASYDAELLARPNFAQFELYCREFRWRLYQTKDVTRIDDAGLPQGIVTSKNQDLAHYYNSRTSKQYANCTISTAIDDLYRFHHPALSRQRAAPTALTNWLQPAVAPPAATATPSPAQASAHALAAPLAPLPPSTDDTDSTPSPVGALPPSRYKEIKQALTKAASEAVEHGLADVGKQRDALKEQLNLIGLGRYFTGAIEVMESAARKRASLPLSVLIAMIRRYAAQHPNAPTCRAEVAQLLDGVPSAQWGTKIQQAFSGHLPPGSVAQDSAVCYLALFDQSSAEALLQHLDTVQRIIAASSSSTIYRSATSPAERALRVLNKYVKDLHRYAEDALPYSVRMVSVGMTLQGLDKRARKDGGDIGLKDTVYNIFGLSKGRGKVGSGVKEVQMAGAQATAIEREDPEGFLDREEAYETAEAVSQAIAGSKRVERTGMKETGVMQQAKISLGGKEYLSHARYPTFGYDSTATITDESYSSQEFFVDALFTTSNAVDTAIPGKVRRQAATFEIEEQVQSLASIPELATWTSSLAFVGNGPPASQTGTSPFVFGHQLEAPLREGIFGEPVDISPIHWINLTLAPSTFSGDIAAFRSSRAPTTAEILDFEKRIGIFAIEQKGQELFFVVTPVFWERVAGLHLNKGSATAHLVGARPKVVRIGAGSHVFVPGEHVGGHAHQGYPISSLEATSYQFGMVYSLMSMIKKANWSSSTSYEEKLAQVDAFNAAEESTLGKILVLKSNADRQARQTRASRNAVITSDSPSVIYITQPQGANCRASFVFWVEIGIAESTRIVRSAAAVPFFGYQEWRKEGGGPKKLVHVPLMHGTMAISLEVEKGVEKSRLIVGRLLDKSELVLESAVSADPYVKEWFESLKVGEHMTNLNFKASPPTTQIWSADGNSEVWGPLVELYETNLPPHPEDDVAQLEEATGSLVTARTNAQRQLESFEATAQSEERSLEELARSLGYQVDLKGDGKLLARK